MLKMPVSDAIKHELTRRLGREWPAGHRLPPVSALARQLGTGQRNTHRAMRELVEAGYLVARPGQGTFVKLDFDASRLPAGMPRASGSNALYGNAGRLAGRHIAVIPVPPLPDSPAGQTVAAATEALKEEGARISSIDPDTAHGGDLSHVDADALLVLPWSLRTSHFRFRSDQVACFVIVSTSVPVAMSGRYDVIRADGEQGGYLAGTHARAMGHRRVAFLGRAAMGNGSPFDETSSVRLRGFETGLDARVDSAHYLCAEHYDDRAAASLVPAYLAMPDRPRAVFAASDDLALGFIVGAAAHGLNFGRDYHIIGFDGQRRGQHILGGPLSTVAVPMADMGKRAADLLASRLLNPDQPVRRLAVGCTLITGTTLSNERTNP